MDIDNRRQHVNRAAAQFDHISTTDKTEGAQTQNSFTYISSENDTSPDEVEELNIPKRAPNLFEIISEGASDELSGDERVQQPSPLHPNELTHAKDIHLETQDKSLVDEFARAINNLEPPKLASTTELPTPEEVNLPHVAPIANNKELASQSIVAEVAGAVASTQVSPHPEHFTNSPQADDVESQSVEDAGFGAKIMDQRRELKMREQEVG